MSAHIYTKQVCDKWHCFGTIQGYDHSFSGLTLDSAQNQMRRKIKKMKESDCKWYSPEQDKSVIIHGHSPRVFHRPSLDHL